MESTDYYQWAEYLNVPKGGLYSTMDKLHSHTKTLERLEKENLRKIAKVLRKIMDEAAVGTEQGGGINYHHMLNILEMEANK